MYIYTLIDKISRMENNSKTFFSKVKTYISDIVSLSDHIDTDKASQYIRSNIDFKGPNAYILAFAIIVASVGLNTNSIAVIIGAMLISPLMGPIFGIGYGLGTNDTSFLKKVIQELDSDGRHQRTGLHGILPCIPIGTGEPHRTAYEDQSYDI